MRGTITSQGWTVKLIFVRENKKKLKKEESFHEIPEG